LKVETVLAYELGYRQQFAANLSADVAIFYNQYADMRSAMLGTQQLAFAPAAHLIQDIIPDNSIKARTSGVEVALDWYPLTWWRIQPSYSFLRLTATSKSGDPISVNNAKNINASDPQHQLSLRSSLSLSDRQQFDLWLRYVSRLGDKDSPLGVPAYTTLDLRYAWRPTRDLEVSLVGQNLLDHSHPEFVPGLLPSQQLELQRGMYVKAKWQF
jgi:iron complex outermembrane receptor protein